MNSWSLFSKSQDLKRSPPGSIDNIFIESQLVKSKQQAKLKENIDYHLLSKEQWQFIFGIYGGGPTVMKLPTKIEAVLSSSSTGFSSNMHSS